MVRAIDSSARAVIDTMLEECRKQNVNIVIAHGSDIKLGSGVAKMVHPEILDQLAEVERILRGAPLPQRLANKARAIKEWIASQDPEDFDSHAAKIRLGDFAEDLIEELQEPKFFHISPEHRALYEQLEPPFGAAVDVTFPDAKGDVAAAARCLALDEWTACVLHLMRALEGPLRVVADRVGVMFPTPMELENWKNIIDNIESKVNAQVKTLEQAKKSLARNDALKSYGESVLQFRHFKNAWRNNAAHSRDHYDEREAQRVYDAVKDFMQTVAAAVSSDDSTDASSVVVP